MENLVVLKSNPYELVEITNITKLILEVASLKILCIFSCCQSLKLLGKSNDIKVEVSNFKITSIPSTEHSNSLIFILSHIKISIFSSIKFTSQIWPPYFVTDTKPS